VAQLTGVTVNVKLNQLEEAGGCTGHAGHPACARLAPARRGQPCCGEAGGADVRLGFLVRENLI